MRPNVKLIDFGNAMDNTGSSSIKAQSLPYRAPEVYVLNIAPLKVQKMRQRSC